MGNRPVDTMGGLGAKLIRQTLMGKIVLGNDKNSARISIKTVHNSRTALVKAHGQVFDMVKQYVDQGVLRVTGGRVHNQSAGLVDHNQVAILIKNIQRRGERLQRTRLGGWQIDLNLLTRLNLKRSF